MKTVWVLAYLIGPAGSIYLPWAPWVPAWLDLLALGEPYLASACLIDGGLVHFSEHQEMIFHVKRKAVVLVIKLLRKTDNHSFGSEV